MGLDSAPLVYGQGSVDRCLGTDDVRRIVRQGLDSMAPDGKRLLVIIPDSTRTMPMPLMFSILAEEAGPRTVALDYLVALGTHQPMSDLQLTRLVGCPVVDGKAGASRIFNHHWEDPETFVTLGDIPAAEIRDLQRRIARAGTSPFRSTGCFLPTTRS